MAQANGYERIGWHAMIDREVVITGVGECLELWDRSTWEAYDTDLTARAPDLTESLGHPS